MKYFHYVRKSTDDKDHQHMSLETQERENLSRFGATPGIDILEKIEEKRSAKIPGRPLFNEMLDRIERGEADGIIAWQPNRLARNSIDAGRLIYLLDTGKLKDLKFATYAFENTPQGKYMLGIAFANSKYDVDALASNVRDGNKTKRLRGWLPGIVPTGYLNVDPKGPAPIIADPDRFAIVKRILEYALTGVYTAPQLLDIATNEWGLRTLKRRQLGGKPLSLSGLYSMLGNPFYAGVIRFNGIDYPGKHPAMITLADFEAIQRIIGRDDAPRPIKHKWDYTGLLRCSCGRSLTAEGTTNRFGSRYTYYHCSRRSDRKCREPYVEVRDLEAQMRDFIQSVTLSPKRHAWALRRGLATAKEANETIALRKTSLERARNEAERVLRNLRHLRTREQITEEEFLEDRKTQSRELARLNQELEQLSPEKVIEPQQALILLSVRGLFWFDKGDGATKRLLLQTMGSNPVVKAGKLNIDAAFPFKTTAKTSEIPSMCPSVTDDRTFSDPEAMQRMVLVVRQLLCRFGEPGLGDPRKPSQ